MFITILAKILVFVLSDDQRVSLSFDLNLDRKETLVIKIDQNKTKDMVTKITIDQNKLAILRALKDS